MVPELAEFRYVTVRTPGNLVWRPHLRVGTLELMRDLQREVWEIWIYTLGALPKLRVQLYFALNGIRLGGVLTGKDHLRAYRAGQAPAPGVKHAHAFGFRVIVDDKEVTRLAGHRYSFTALLASTHHHDWTAPIRQHCLSTALPPELKRTKASEPEPLALAA